MTIQIVDFEATQPSSAGGLLPIVLHQSEGLTTMLLCLEPGQVVGPCAMSTRVQYIVMSGGGQLRVADEQAGLKTGSVVVVQPDVVRSIVAVERMRLLAVQVP